jgi:hypothetical protein
MPDTSSVPRDPFQLIQAVVKEASVTGLILALVDDQEIVFR